LVNIEFFVELIDNLMVDNDLAEEWSLKNGVNM